MQTLYISPDSKTKITVFWDGYLYQINQTRENQTQSLTLKKDEGNIFVQRLTDNGWKVKNGRSRVHTTSKRSNRNGSSSV